MYKRLFGKEKIKKLYEIEPIIIMRRPVNILPEHRDDLKEFSLVSIVKFVLTEGEKFVIFAFRDFVRLIDTWYNQSLGLECLGRIRFNLEPNLDCLQVCFLTNRGDGFQFIYQVSQE